jgi:ketosteroid isomerase-like protein
MAVDLDLIRGAYEVHNAAPAEFPDALARDFLHANAEFVEAAAVPGATTHRGSDAVAVLFRERFEAGVMRIDDLELTAVDEHRVLAAFRIHMRGASGGAQAAMRVWNLITVEGSRIARVEEFTDEPAALGAARR